MMLPLLAALLLAVVAAQVQVVDEGGKPVAGATVVFHSAAGASASEATDTAGNAAAPPAFDAASVTVSAPGYATITISVPDAKASIVLHAQPGVIGKVSVATGSARNLHRLAVPAAALDRTAIAVTPAYATDALLRSLPGFDFVRSNSAFTAFGNLRVSFAGAGEDRGLVLADDVPAQDGFGGQVDWLAYPPSALSSVELLRGPGAALYGANAIGGVLQLRSFSPNTDSRALPDGNLDLQDGTPHRTSAAFNYRFALAPNLTAAVSTQTGQQSYYDLTPGYQTNIDREAVSSSTATRAQVRYGFGNSAIDVGGLYANDEQNEGRPNYTFQRNLAQTDLHFTTSTQSSTFGVVAYNRDTDITNAADQAPTAPGVLRYVQDIPTRESGVAGSWFLTGGNNEIALRADEKFVYGDATQDGPTGALQSKGTGKQQYAGVALEDTYESGRFQLIGGLRGDLVTFSDGVLVTTKTTIAPPRADRVLSPRLAGRYDLTRGVAVRASTGGGFREPFLNELLRGYQIGKVVYNPNPRSHPGTERQLRVRCRRAHRRRSPLARLHQHASQQRHRVSDDLADVADSQQRRAHANRRNDADIYDAVSALHAPARICDLAIRTHHQRARVRPRQPPPVRSFPLRRRGDRCRQRCLRLRRKRRLRRRDVRRRPQHPNSCPQP